MKYQFARCFAVNILCVVEFPSAPGDIRAIRGGIQQTKLDNEKVSDRYLLRQYVVNGDVIVLVKNKYVLMAMFSSTTYNVFATIVYYNFGVNT